MEIGTKVPRHRLAEVVSSAMAPAPLAGFRPRVRRRPLIRYSW
jgi:hypothetical protein